MKDMLSALATNLHIVVISMLIIALDLGVVRIGSNQANTNKQPSITLNTGNAARTAPPQAQTQTQATQPGTNPYDGSALHFEKRVRL